MTDTLEQATRAVAVLSMQSFRAEHETHLSLEEMIFRTAHAALAEAGLDHAGVHGVVLSGNDQTDGRVISCMVSAGPASGVDRDTTMIASSADHALIYGHLRLLSGQGDNVLVVGWGKPSESISPERAELMSAEPYLLRNIGMNNTIAAALQASALGAVPTAGSATVSWPLTADDLPARGDVVHAVVLGVEGSFTPGAELAWVSGAGWATDAYDMGARDVTSFPALTTATGQITGRGGPGPDSWDLVEIGAPSEQAVAGATRALGLHDGVPVNDSGSLAARLTTPQASGMDRMLAAVEQLRATGGATTSESAPRYAAGIGMQGFGGQGAAVMVFTDRKDVA